MGDPHLTALLLTNRLVEAAASPLSAGEFWRLLAIVGDSEALADRTADQIAELGVDPVLAQRITALLGAATAFAFERQRLLDEGIDLLSAVDERFPARLRTRLGDACPAVLLVAGDVARLAQPALGVVGSRDASPEALDVAVAAAHAAATHGWGVVSGLARGIDQTAMGGALDAGAPVVGVPTEGLRVVGKAADIRRRVHDGELTMASPYGPTARFSAGNAMGRNKIVYGLAEVTLVVCSDSGTGGTWEGAKESLRRGFGPVAVWMGAGSGLGNAALVKLGATPITDLATLFDLPAQAASASQTSLFDP